MGLLSFMHENRENVFLEYTLDIVWSNLYVMSHLNKV